MKNMLALFGVLLAADCGAAVIDGTLYNLRGPVSGYKTADKAGTCYVAITASDWYYKDGYHFVDDRQLCKLARASYLLRSDLRARAAVRYGTDTNELVEFEATRDGAPYWPPYRTASNRAEYKLIGPVNGYLLVIRNMSCFVSIKGNDALSNGYHEVKNRSHCDTLFGAYLDGSTVQLSVKKAKNINQVVSVALGDNPKVYWPPYGKH
ncbi:hypothetical protein ABZR86_15475 [Dyella marensis]|uniref:Uncharacterized protein n=1 Tax=Dyella marensis TaxID=500610 RepID=A0A1I2GN65_9GAMM|nr:MULTISPECIES: hypothetical protein [Dyella]SFF18449.1 hypothetical protein SAMN02799615_02697 [Dyella marensis]